MNREPYRGDLIPREVGAEIARLTEECEALHRAADRRGLAVEAVTAGAFALAGVAVISTLYVDVAAWSVAWTSLVGGVWGVIRRARADRVQPW